MLTEDFYFAIHEAELRHEEEEREKKEEQAIEQAKPIGMYFRGADNKLRFLPDGASQPVVLNLLSIADPVAVRISPKLQYVFFTAADNTVQVTNGTHSASIGGQNSTTATRITAAFLHHVVHVFAVSLSGELLHSWRDLTTNEKFTDFQSLGGELIQGEPVSVSADRQSDAILVLANDYRLGTATISLKEGDWTTWESVAPRFHSPICTVSVTSGHYDAFGALNGKVAHLWHDTAVLEWRSFESPLTARCLPNLGGVAAVASDKGNSKSQLHLFFQSPESQLVYVCRDEHQWQEPVILGGLLTHPPLARLVREASRWEVQVITRWADGRLYTRNLAESGQWGEWTGIDAIAAGMPSL